MAWLIELRLTYYYLARSTIPPSPSAHIALLNLFSFAYLCIKQMKENNRTLANSADY